jgi:hypothetical protein
MTQTTDTFDVFLSYGHEDFARAKHIYEQLTSSGITCWMDRELCSGEQWANIVAQRIDEAKQFVLLGSSDSYQSPWVKKELHHAASRRAGFVHHVIIEQAEQPPEFRLLLADRHWLDASGANGDLEIQEKLIPAIRAQLKLSQEEVSKRDSVRALGIVASAVTDGIETHGLGASGDTWLATLLDPGHLSRLVRMHSVSAAQGDRLIAVVDPSADQTGAGSIAFLTTRLSWHDPQGLNKLQCIGWTDMDHVGWERSEFDGTGIVSLEAHAAGPQRKLRVYCQTESFGQALARLLADVASKVRRSESAAGTRGLHGN